MDSSSSDMAKQVALAACDFERRRTGNLPRSVTVVLSGDTLVITLHGALSPAELALAGSPGGAARVQEYYRQLFNNSSDALRQEIKRIIGVDVREAAVEFEPSIGAVVKVFATGTVVQVFLLADSVTAGTWSGSGRDGQV
ncbi:MAG: Na-translocating system protein MpsC family protein [Pirellulales bacterium]